MREYLYIEHLVERTPWTRVAIETMVRRGLLKRGVHYFQPTGRGGRLVFKWRTIVELIEGQLVGTTGAVIERAGTQKVSDDGVEKATEALRRLLR